MRTSDFVCVVYNLVIVSKCYRKNRCNVRNCDMHHHTLVHEIYLKFIEHAKAKRELERAQIERNNVPTSQEVISPPPNQAVEPQEQQHRQSVYSGHETDGSALVEVLPVFGFGETGK